MAFDAATLLSRTTAGDGELAKPTHGLSLGQRKLLAFLDQPQALEELADEHALERAKLERDLAKLASLGLVAIDGQHPEATAATVVLGGLRAPSMLRWLVPALCVVCAAVVYYAMRSAPSHRMQEPSALIAATDPVTAPVRAAAPAVIAAANVADIPEPALATRQAPRDIVAALPPVARAHEPEVAASASPMHADADVQQDVAPASRAPHASMQPLNTFQPTELPTLRVSDPQRVRVAAAAPANTLATEPAVHADRALTQANAAMPEAGVPVAAVPVPAAVLAPVATPIAVATHGSPAANTGAALGAAAIAVQPPAPERLAMAAPTGAVVHPPAPVRLLPLTRQDPDFPREAIVRGVSSGTVKARLAIDAGGHVSAVSIVDARPTGVFDRAVTDALSHWTFPAGEPGRNTEVEVAFHRD